MKPVRVRGTLRLETEIWKGMWVSHRITAFLHLGKEKALTVFPPTLVWFYLVNRISCPWVIFSDVGRIMRSHSSLPVYIIARIALGVSRHCATLCDIVRQVSGAIRARQETTGYLAGVISIPFKANCSVTGENH